MAKTKGKAKIAASNVPSQMEAISDNDMIAESAPSESVEIEEAAMTGVLDKSEVDNKEEVSDGSDESEEVGETKESEDGLDEPNEVDNVEENKDGLDKSEHGDKIEETTNALDKSVEEDKEEETDEDKEEVESLATDVSEGEEVEERDVTGDKEEKPKEDGKYESLATDVPEGEEVEERDVTGDKEEKPKEDGKQEYLATDIPEDEEIEERDVTGEAKDNGKGENAPNKKAKRMRRKKKAAASAGSDANKSSDTDKKGISAAEKDSKMAELTIEDGKEESLATDVSEGEEVEAKDNGKGENAPNEKGKRMRMRKKKAAGGAANDASKSSNADKQGTSAAEDLKVADGMGLIFMCNAKTKNDCFRYKVFGLPASKKEIVAKVYKGMRLFLFDIDLKLMYGIYKAADFGGYNIEPKAFKSAFPSQVRFSVLKDCLPLPEEKFKAAIKGNYYARNKFKCELSPEQVMNLCKLFQSVGKTSRKKSYGEVIRAPEQTNSSRGRKTSHSERVRLDDSIPRNRKRSRHERVRLERVRMDDNIARDRKRSRHERVRRDDIIPRGQDLYARREVYASPPSRLLALPPPSLPLVSYAYVRPADDYYYREPLECHDPYGVYREPASREAVYREAVSRLAVPREALYREPLSEVAVSREPIPYHEAICPASLTPAAYAPPSTYYRY